MTRPGSDCFRTVTDSIRIFSHGVEPSRVTIKYGKDKVSVRDSFVPIGIAGLLLSGSGLGWLVHDRLVNGIFWGWGILVFIAACVLACGWVATCYRIVCIDRKANLVSAVYRGGYSFQGSHSLWARQEREWPLSDYVRVTTNRHYETAESGQVAVYTIALEGGRGGSFPVHRHTSESLIQKETVKLAEFLSLPHRKNYG